jgi:glutathione S-transferase
MKLYYHPVSTVSRPVVLFALDSGIDLDYQPVDLCGDELKIADHFGAGILTIGEITHCDLAQYPNVARWYASMKSRPNWAKANEAFNGMVASTKEASFVTV